MVFLKKFVADHPGNQMGWYLLGKEYEAQGKQGKAHYCYAKAGEIYAAFEKKEPPFTLQDVKERLAADKRAGSLSSPAEAETEAGRRRRGP
ncbi:hypothetical protein N6H14_32740 [Paenibacillus sp. CC-CFT747]|nr:hypothetical protein N6H14_32740 [Paenibacillus sp. CC-CFT747]